jgi:hypothetical protein
MPILLTAVILGGQLARLPSMWSEPADVVAFGGETVAPGSHSDFDDFYRAELPRLVTLARALCGSAVADDVAQEAMLAAYRRWRVVGDLEHPEAWVRRTCGNMPGGQQAPEASGAPGRSLVVLRWRT